MRGIKMEYKRGSISSEPPSCKPGAKQMVIETNSHASVVKEAEKRAQKLNPMRVEAMEMPASPSLYGGNRPALDKNKLTIDNSVAKCEFSEAVKLLTIPAVDIRLICYYLGIDSINDMKSSVYEACPMIGLLMMQGFDKFMADRGYVFSGEINFNQEGSIIPPGKTTWIMGEDKELVFTNNAFRFYRSGNDKIVFMFFTNLNERYTCIKAFHTSENVCKKILVEAEKYIKKNNCFRGAKLKDINMWSGTFDIVETKAFYTWDNFYYPKNIKDLFDLEVFGFLDNVEKYNEEGISKRGLMIWGKPGTGKSTIGYIMCNHAKDFTIIWITPELIRSNGIDSISLLYKLTDFVSPAVIILEDLDLFAEDRSSGGDNLRLGCLMNILDGINSVSNAITIATTNRLDMIEKALRDRPGRFDRVVEISSLDDDLRTKMFNNRLSGFKNTEEVIDRVVSKTNGWTGAECQEFVNTLNLHFIKEKDTSKVLTTEIVDNSISIMKSFGICKIKDPSNKYLGAATQKTGD